jgi:hypothetical protein
MLFADEGVARTPISQERLRRDWALSMLEQSWDRERSKAQCHIAD